MTAYLLLEWVGTWIHAWRGSGETAPIFPSEADAWDWLHRYFGADADVDRYRVVPIQLPDAPLPDAP